MAKARVVSAAIYTRSGNSVKLVWLNGAVMCLIVLCAFAVIQASHSCRQLYARLQILEASRWHMEEDYGRLLLEQSTWASYHRIGKLAGRELGMQPPAITDLKVFVQ